MIIDKLNKLSPNFLKIKAKIYLTIAMLLFLYIITFLTFSTIILNTSRIISKFNTVEDPSKDEIVKLQKYIIESKLSTLNWIYSRYDQEGKKTLNDLHYKYIPEVISELKILSVNWNSESDLQLLQTIIENCSETILTEKSIISKLKTIKDYEDKSKVFLARNILETQLYPSYNFLNNKIQLLVDSRQKSKTEEINTIVNTIWITIIFMIFLAIILTVIAFVIASYQTNNIINAIKNITNIIKNISKGKLEKNNFDKRGDEIGEIQDALNILTINFEKSTQFAKEIRDNNFENNIFEPLSKYDVLGNSLIELRDRLKKNEENNKNREWIQNSITDFNLFCLDPNKDILIFSDQFLQKLSQLLETQLSVLYLLKGNDEDKYLESIACYSLNRKKYLKQKISIYDSLAGQAVLDAEKIFLTEIPSNYTHIFSGTGIGNPNCILIMPVINQGIIIGVIEIASFNILNNSKVKLVQQLAEILAVTITNINMNNSNNYYDSQVIGI